MASIEKLIEDYMDAAVGPEDLQQMGLLQLANASVQDDAVGRAAQNLQGVEKANRSALENYMMAQDEMAQAEADKALQMAQQRLSSIDMNISQILMTPAGISKEGKSQLAQLRAERESILKAFPQLGSAESVGGVSDDDNVDIVGSNDRDVWLNHSKNASLEDIAKLYADNMGQVPEGLESMYKFRVRNSPELTSMIRTDPKYRSIAHLAGDTLGDAQDEAARKKKAAASAALAKEISDAEKIARSILSDSASGNEWDSLSKKEKENLKKHLSDLPADIRSDISSYVSAVDN